jgi:hypothetical protein
MSACATIQPLPAWRRPPIPRLLLAAWVTVAAATAAAPPPAMLPAVSERSLRVCVAADAPEPVRAAAARILAAAPTHPLLVFLRSSHTVTELTDSAALLAAPPGARACDHLVIVGLPEDPLVRTVWQREARPAPGGFYLFGFGHLCGDLGYVESHRNPFLHGRGIPRAPYETQVVAITGSTPAGLELAVRAFLEHGLANGVVAAPGWARPRPNLLERDPALLPLALPDWVPDTLPDGWVRVGVTQAAEDEYRGVLADAGVAPRVIWRFKYARPGVWDAGGAENAMANYAAGLHRRAYGNTLWAAQFADAGEAAAAAPKIAKAARLHRAGAAWQGPQPPYAWDTETPPGETRLWQRGEWLLMSTLPAPAAAGLGSG